MKRPFKYSLLALSLGIAIAGYKDVLPLPSDEAPTNAKLAVEVQDQISASDYLTADEISANQLTLARQPDALKLIQDGDHALSSNDYFAAYKFYSAAAQSKNTSAIIKLAELLEMGVIGGEPKIERALELYQTASDLGSIDATLLLASFYELGINVPEDINKASELYLTAANNESPKALRWLVERARFEPGFAKKAQVMQWNLSLVKTGDMKAMLDAGNAYYAGAGVNQDKDMALKLFEDAAEQGNDEFQYSVTNSAGKSELAKGTVFVECVVDTPILDGVTETVIEDTPKLLSPNYNLDGGVISKYDNVSDPANGTAEWVDGNILYSPVENYCGFDTFTYQITTEGGKSNIATSNINVECVQDVPTVDGQEEIKITVKTTKDYTYLANDVDGDTLTATMNELNKSSLPESVKFAFDGSKGTLSLSPSDTDMGDYTLELLVDDGHNNMAMKRIAVYIRDDRPVTLNSILLKTFSIPQEFETPAGKKMNAVYFTGIKDSLGNLITGTYDLTITIDSSVNFPVTILGQRIEPGVPTVISYDIPSPGVVDVKAIPTVAGEDGVINFQISFDVK